MRRLQGAVSTRMAVARSTALEVQRLRRRRHAPRPQSVVNVFFRNAVDAALDAARAQRMPGWTLIVDVQVRHTTSLSCQEMVAYLCFWHLLNVKKTGDTRQCWRTSEHT
ncbi:hypothetical protein HH212_14525 [Massilia forsythiae]|uniref:Uncharacterized protein n=1 Tax=Massilia forsythiae TaxID=2728020 RepID=A0A7Z2VX97_9BURK|nr:hypothetical protein [Massilia forsythiae]QJE01097.1 hypothetical protein HH212_14525 [Massilia forsythiae]